MLDDFGEIEDVDVTRKSLKKMRASLQNFRTKENALIRDATEKRFTKDLVLLSEHDKSIDTERADPYDPTLTRGMRRTNASGTAFLKPPVRTAVNEE